MADKLKDYEEGFNHGYIISKYIPELAEEITKHPNPDNEYFLGMVAGKQEHRMEKIRDKSKGKVSKNSITKNDISSKER